jgi:hypothetical protein
MEKITAYCGLACDSCLILLATLEQDESQQQTMRESIAEKCSAIYGMSLKPEDITDCDGCRSNTGRIFSGCLSCGIRTCAIERNLSSCAYCNEYACVKLQKHFELDPQAQIRLEEIRQIINP